MDPDRFEDKWTNIRNYAKKWWEKLTDEDVDKVGGKLEVLLDLLQEKYGYSREQADEEITQRVGLYEASMNRKTAPVKK